MLQHVCDWRPHIIINRGLSGKHSLKSDASLRIWLHLALSCAEQLCCSRLALHQSAMLSTHSVSSRPTPILLLPSVRGYDQKETNDLSFYSQSFLSPSCSHNHSVTFSFKCQYLSFGILGQYIIYPCFTHIHYVGYCWYMFVFSVNSLICNCKPIGLLFSNFSSALKLASAWAIRTEFFFLQIRSCHGRILVSRYVNLSIFSMSAVSTKIFLSFALSFSWFSNISNSPSSSLISRRLLNLTRWTEMHCDPISYSFIACSIDEWWRYEVMKIR